MRDIMAGEIQIVREKEECAKPVRALHGKIAVVGDGATATGFRLAGVSEVYALEGKEAERKIAELLDKDDTEILIVNERISSSLDWRLKKKINTIARPVVVEIPDKFGTSGQTESLKAMVKRALGFELASNKEG